MIWGKARPTQRVEVTLDELRAVRRRIAALQLAASDWALFDALVLQLLGRAEGKTARMVAKVAASAGAAPSTSEPPLDPKVSDAAAASPASSSPSSDAPATSSDEAASPATGSGSAGDGEKPEPGDDPKPRKGHGRNGASAFRAAQHFFYALGFGVIGAVCSACQIGKMHRYREKVIIRIVGQPMFHAEQHHHEQARCRNCGRVVRADGAACVHEGVGSEYIRYDWSACAMLLFMHYTGGDPFKRVESHHAGWGVPMPDANQWEVVDQADDLLLPLSRAIEQHAIQRATDFRIDDTGSVVITLKRQIEAELASLRAQGKSTKGVRTGINATGIYWETPDGDHAMSIIATARAHGVEPVAYLTECPRSHEDPAKRPEHYLPWVYRARDGGADAAARAADRTAEPEPSDARLRDLAPEIGEDDPRGVATPEQDLQLASEEVRAVRRSSTGARQSAQRPERGRCRAPTKRAAAHDPRLGRRVQQQAP